MVNYCCSRDKFGLKKPETAMAEWVQPFALLQHVSTEDLKALHHCSFRCCYIQSQQTPLCLVLDLLIADRFYTKST